MLKTLAYPTETTAAALTPLAEAEAELQALETEYGALSAKIEGLKQAPTVAAMSDEARKAALPLIIDRAAPYLGLLETRRKQMLLEAEEAEIPLRDRLVAARGRVARLRQSEASQKAARLRGQYMDLAEAIAAKLMELESLLVEESNIRRRAEEIAAGRSPLPDLSLALLGSRQQINSPVAHWFARYRAAKKG